MRESWTDLALRVDRHGDDALRAGMDELPVATLAGAMLHETGRLEPSYQLTPRHPPIITERWVITVASTRAAELAVSKVAEAGRYFLGAAGFGGAPLFTLFLMAGIVCRYAQMDLMSSSENTL